MLDKKKILGIFLPLGESFSAQEIADITRLDLKKVQKHLKQLVKEKKLKGVRRFRINKENNVHNVRTTN